MCRNQDIVQRREGNPYCIQITEVKSTSPGFLCQLNSQSVKQIIRAQFLLYDTLTPRLVSYYKSPTENVVLELRNKVGAIFLLCACVCMCTQSCLTLCDPMVCSLPVSSVHGIFPARILEQAAISFYRVSSSPRT